MNEQNKSQYQFINPYNFVSLGNKCKRRYISDNEKKFTGYMECELETKTPLIMIDSMNKIIESNQHTVYPSTFMLNNVPAIPASELRGCIRSKFETLTNSCLSTIEEDAVFTGRFKNGQMREPGLLDFTDENNVRLYSARKYELVFDNEPQEELKTGDIITFHIEEDQDGYFAVYDPYGKNQGIYKIGEEFKKENHKHVFIKKNDITDTLQNKTKLKSMYNKSVQLSRENFKSKNTERNHLSASKANLRPVWYQIMDNGIVYISLGQNGQVQFNKTVEDVLPNEYNPCSNPDNLCEACYVFGTVNEKKSISIPSRVRFSDAKMINFNQNNCYEYPKPITIAALAGPKYSNAMFYLRLYSETGQPEFTNFVWNVDTINTRFDSKYIRNGRVSIRGRKEYWHHVPKKIDITASKLNSTVNPVRKGAKYIFKVYFDDISKEQLDHLIMAVNLENESDYCHKLGMGKPLGYGSVKIKVNNVKVRNLNFDEKSKSIVRNVVDYVTNCKTLDDAFKNLNETQFKEIKHLYSFDFLTKYNVRVDYPRNKENGDIFEWFKSGKKSLPFADNEKRIVQSGELEIKKNDKFRNNKPNNQKQNNFHKSNNYNKPKKNW